MSYINRKTRIFRKAPRYDLTHVRSEARMKRYYSATDNRAWCDIVEQRRQHILELIAKGAFCLENLIPLEVLLNAGPGRADEDIEALLRKIAELEEILDAHEKIPLTDEQQQKLDELESELEEEQKKKDETRAKEPQPADKRRPEEQPIPRKRASSAKPYKAYPEKRPRESPKEERAEKDITVLYDKKQKPRDSERKSEPTVTRGRGRGKTKEDRPRPGTVGEKGTLPPSGKKRKPSDSDLDEIFTEAELKVFAGDDKEGRPKPDKAKPKTPGKEDEKQSSAKEVLQAGYTYKPGDEVRGRPKDKETRPVDKKREPDREEGQPPEPKARKLGEKDELAKGKAGKPSDTSKEPREVKDKKEQSAVKPREKDEIPVPKGKDDSEKLGDTKRKSPESGLLTEGGVPAKGKKDKDELSAGKPGGKDDRPEKKPLSKGKYDSERAGDAKRESPTPESDKGTKPSTLKPAEKDVKPEQKKALPEAKDDSERVGDTKKKSPTPERGLFTETGVPAKGKKDKERIAGKPGEKDGKSEQKPKGKDDSERAEDTKRKAPTPEGGLFTEAAKEKKGKEPSTTKPAEKDGKPEHKEPLPKGKDDSERVGDTKKKSPKHEDGLFTEAGVPAKRKRDKEEPSDVKPGEMDGKPVEKKQLSKGKVDDSERTEDVKRKSPTPETGLFTEAGIPPKPKKEKEPPSALKPGEKEVTIDEKKPQAKGKDDLEKVGDTKRKSPSPESGLFTEAGVPTKAIKYKEAPSAVKPSVTDVKPEEEKPLSKGKEDSERAKQPKKKPPAPESGLFTEAGVPAKTKKEEPSAVTPAKGTEDLKRAGEPKRKTPIPGSRLFTEAGVPVKGKKDREEPSAVKSDEKVSEPEKKKPLSKRPDDSERAGDTRRKTPTPSTTQKEPSPGKAYDDDEKDEPTDQTYDKKEEKPKTEGDIKYKKVEELISKHGEEPATDAAEIKKHKPIADTKRATKVDSSGKLADKPYEEVKGKVKKSKDSDQMKMDSKEPADKTTKAHMIKPTDQPTADTDEMKKPQVVEPVSKTSKKYDPDKKFLRVSFDDIQKDALMQEEKAGAKKISEKEKPAKTTILLDKLPGDDVEEPQIAKDGDKVDTVAKEKREPIPSTDDSKRGKVTPKPTKIDDEKPIGSEEPPKSIKYKKEQPSEDDRDKIRQGKPPSDTVPVDTKPEITMKQPTDKLDVDDKGRTKKAKEQATDVKDRDYPDIAKTTDDMAKKAKPSKEETTEKKDELTKPIKDLKEKGKPKQDKVGEQLKKGKDITPSDEKEVEKTSLTYEKEKLLKDKKILEAEKALEKEVDDGEPEGVLAAKKIPQVKRDEPKPLQEDVIVGTPEEPIEPVQEKPTIEIKEPYIKPADKQKIAKGVDRKAEHGAPVERKPAEVKELKPGTMAEIEKPDRKDEERDELKSPTVRGRGRRKSSIYDEDKSKKVPPRDIGIKKPQEQLFEDDLDKSKKGSPKDIGIEKPQEQLFEDDLERKPDVIVPEDKQKVKLKAKEAIEKEMGKLKKKLKKKREPTEQDGSSEEEDEIGSIEPLPEESLVFEKMKSPQKPESTGKKEEPKIHPEEKYLQKEPTPFPDREIHAKKKIDSGKPEAGEVLVLPSPKISLDHEMALQEEKKKKIEPIRSEDVEGISPPKISPDEKKAVQEEEKKIGILKPEKGEVLDMPSRKIPSDQVAVPEEKKKISLIKPEKGEVLDMPSRKIPSDQEVAVPEEKKKISLIKPEEGEEPIKPIEESMPSEKEMLSLDDKEKGKAKDKEKKIPKEKLFDGEKEEKLFDEDKELTPYEKQKLAEIEFKKSKLKECKAICSEKPPEESIDHHEKGKAKDKDKKIPEDKEKLFDEDKEHTPYEKQKLAEIEFKKPKLVECKAICSKKAPEESIDHLEMDKAKSRLIDIVYDEEQLPGKKSVTQEISEIKVSEEIVTESDVGVPSGEQAIISAEEEIAKIDHISVGEPSGEQLAISPEKQIDLRECQAICNTKILTLMNQEMQPISSTEENSATSDVQEDSLDEVLPSNKDISISKDSKTEKAPSSLPVDVEVLGDIENEILEPDIYDQIALPTDVLKEPFSPGTAAIKTCVASCAKPALDKPTSDDEPSDEEYKSARTDISHPIAGTSTDSPTRKSRDSQHVCAALIRRAQERCAANREATGGIITETPSIDLEEDIIPRGYFVGEVPTDTETTQPRSGLPSWAIVDVPLRGEYETTNVAAYQPIFEELEIDTIKDDIPETKPHEELPHRESLKPSTVSRVLFGEPIGIGISSQKSLPQATSPTLSGLILQRRLSSVEDQKAEITEVSISESTPEPDQDLEITIPQTPERESADGELVAMIEEDAIYIPEEGKVTNGIEEIHDDDDEQSRSLTYRMAPSLTTEEIQESLTHVDTGSLDEFADATEIISEKLLTAEDISEIPDDEIKALENIEALSADIEFEGIEIVEEQATTAEKLMPVEEITSEMAIEGTKEEPSDVELILEGIGEIPATEEKEQLVTQNEISEIDQRILTTDVDEALEKQISIEAIETTKEDEDEFLTPKPSFDVLTQQVSKDLKPGLVEATDIFLSAKSSQVGIQETMTEPIKIDAGTQIAKEDKTIDTHSLDQQTQKARKDRETEMMRKEIKELCKKVAHLQSEIGKVPPPIKDDSEKTKKPGRSWFGSIISPSQKTYADKPCKAVCAGPQMVSDATQIGRPPHDATEENIHKPHICRAKCARQDMPEGGTSTGSGPDKSPCRAKCARLPQLPSTSEDTDPSKFFREGTSGMCKAKCSRSHSPEKMTQMGEIEMDQRRNN